MSKFFIPMIGRLLRLSFALLLTGCALLAPSSGPGAIFESPKEAIADGFESGWLGQGQVSELVLHEQIDSSQYSYVLHSSYVHSRGFEIGVAYAEPRAWGWSTEGRRSFSTPPLAKSERLSCAIESLSRSGEEVLIVIGQFLTPPDSPNNGESIESIEVIFDSGLRKEAVIRNNAFAAMTNEATAIESVLALNEDGQVVHELEATACLTDG